MTGRTLKFSIGDRFSTDSKLSFLERLPKGKLKCLCDCGNTSVIATYDRFRTKSCGCSSRVFSKRDAAIRKKWSDMLRRCNDPEFSGYGDRGITVCEDWREFDKFREWANNNGFSPELELERNDTNGRYEPSNCSFVTRTKQARNTRLSKWWIVHGIRYESMSHAARELNVSPSTIRDMCNGRPDGSKASLPNCYSVRKYET